MIEESIITETTMIKSEDEKHLYELRRKWCDEGSSALVIELYPAVSSPEQYDLSGFHLQNHLREMNIKETRVVNIFSTIFRSKPLSKQLKYDEENINYILNLVNDSSIDVIIIAWGSTLVNHSIANDAKREVLQYLKDNNLQDKVKNIMVDNLDTLGQIGVHPLYLGLRFNQYTWGLTEYPLDYALEQLRPNQLTDKKPKREVKRKTKSTQKGE